MKSFFALVLASVSISSLAMAECPVINGKFVYDEDRRDTIARHTITMFTRKSGQIFNYTYDKEGHYQAADGIRRRVRSGNVEAMILYKCVDNYLYSEFQLIGSNIVVVKKLSVMEGGNLTIESNQAGLSGIYERQSQE
jgi:hypothetical protein